MSKVELFQGDCLDLMKDIPDGSVDCIITDPPYMSAMQHNGEMTDFADCNNLKPFFSTLFKEFSRILSDKGCVYMFCDWRSVSFYLPLSAQFLPVKNLIVWDKMGAPGNFYTLQHELIIFSTFNNKFHAKGATNVIRSPGFSCGAKKKQMGKKFTPLKNP